jgi:hypothetical protein
MENSKHNGRPMLSVDNAGFPLSYRRGDFVVIKHFCHHEVLHMRDHTPGKILILFTYPR